MTTLPDWTYSGSRKDSTTFVSAVALAGLMDRPLHISAATQRAIFGFSVFGRKCVKVRKNDSAIVVSVATCFGTDANYTTLHAYELDKIVAAGKQIQL